MEDLIPSQMVALNQMTLSTRCMAAWLYYFMVLVTLAIVAWQKLYDWYIN